MCYFFLREYELRIDSGVYYFVEIFWKTSIVCYFCEDVY
jgi:hypothetical protein